MDAWRGIVPEDLSPVTALLAGAAGVAGSFLLAGSTDAFVGVPVNAVVVEVTPDVVVSLSILYLGTVGELIGFLVALAFVVGLFAGAALVAQHFVDDPHKIAGVVGIACAAIAFGLTGARVPSLSAGLAAGGVAGILEYHERPGLDPETRRKTLAAIGGVVGFGVASYLIGDRAHSGTPPALVEAMDWDETRRAAVQDGIRTRLSEAESKSLDVDGLPGLVSPIEDHYEVDINYLDPKADAAGWELSITGEVENEFSIAYGDVVGMEPEHRFVTLRCVSDPIDGDLMDTALWTGIPIESLLDRAGPQGNFVVLRGVDDYYAEFPIEAIEGGFLAYGMNGSLLPSDHGHPLRALILGHWGEVNVKWLTEIEVHTSRVISYWETRGWQGTGPVNTVAKLEAVDHLDDGRVQVAGHAYAGLHGVEAVEVSVDGGETWSEATLSDPLSETDVWRQWAYEWSPPSGRHTVVVRAIDGLGNVQPREKRTPQPSGATGWVSRTISV